MLPYCSDIVENCFDVACIPCWGFNFVNTKFSSYAKTQMKSYISKTEINFLLIILFYSSLCLIFSKYYLDAQIVAKYSLHILYHSAFKAQAVTLKDMYFEVIISH